MATNLQIKFIKSLQLKKNRWDHQQYVCEGTKLVSELVQNDPNNLVAIFCNQEWADEQKKLHPQTLILSQSQLEKMSGMTSTPNVLAVAKMRDSSTFITPSKGTNLYLDQLSDPGNMGTIIRTADWYGIKQIYLSPNCVDIYSPKVIQASMGSHFRMNFNIIDFNQLTKSHEFDNIYATAMDGKDINHITDVNQSLIVLGSESHGVSESIFKQANAKISIPSFGKAESLNVSVASGIILHQFVSKIN